MIIMYLASTILYFKRVLPQLKTSKICSNTDLFAASLCADIYIDSVVCEIDARIFGHVLPVFNCSMLCKRLL